MKIKKLNCGDPHMFRTRHCYNEKCWCKGVAYESKYCIHCDTPKEVLA